jgi:outer membrane protein assembly factor BamB
MSPDGRQVAISSAEGVEVIDVASGRAERPPFPVPTGNTAEFSPDGESLLIAGSDGAVHVRATRTGAERWRRHLGGETAAATSWSGDGRLVTARSLRGEAYILDGATGADVAGPLPGVANLAFSPDGAAAVTTGAELRVVDTRTGTVTRSFPGTGGFWVAVFVRDGRWISAMTGSGVVELFDIESGSRVGVPLRVARDAISDRKRSVIVSRGLYWGGPDDPVVFYDLDPASWAETACNAAGRNLTREEWEHYLGSLGDYAPTCPQYPAAIRS